MKGYQSTVFCADGEAIVKKKILSVTREADEAAHLESGVINVYPQMEYQVIEGFGAAITEASAYLLSTLDPDIRKKFLKEFFGEEGSKYRFVRTHIDSCDFALSEYQAVENPVADPEFTSFTIDRDRKYIIPVIKEALEINQNAGNEPISVLLSPWSPPYQWKTAPEKQINDAAVYGGIQKEESLEENKPSRVNGGSLKPEYYGSWARYLVKYVQAYLEEGIPVTMLTMQNESIAATDWDSCVWTAGEQKKFLTENLYPEFKKADLLDKVGIFIWDHNKERVLEWSMDMLDDTTMEMVAGIAFHWYSGDHFEAVQMTHEKFPGKTLMLSECCVLHRPGQASFYEEFGVPRTMLPEHAEEKDAQDYAHDIIGNLNAGMNRWIDWNICVDEKGGPRHKPMGFAAGCIVEGHTYSKKMTYYYIRQFSEYIKPGAKRIGFSRCDDKVEITAAKNKDDSITIVLLNRGNEDGFYAVRMNGDIIKICVPAGTISTVVLSEEN